MSGKQKKAHERKMQRKAAQQKKKQQNELFEITRFLFLKHSIADIRERCETADATDKVAFNYTARHLTMVLQYHRLSQPVIGEDEGIPIEDTSICKTNLTLVELLERQWKLIQKEHEYRQFELDDKDYVDQIFTNLISVFIDDNSIAPIAASLAEDQKIQSQKEALQQEEERLRLQEWKLQEEQRKILQEDLNLNNNEVVEDQHLKADGDKEVLPEKDNERLQDEESTPDQETQGSPQKDGGEATEKFKPMLITMTFLKTSSNTIDEHRTEGLGYIDNKYKNRVECFYETYLKKGSLNLDGYLDNLELLAFDKNILGFQGYQEDEDSITFVFEKYLNTVKDVASACWKTTTSGESGFSDTGFTTVTQLLELIQYLVDNQIKISAFNSETVVFTKPDNSCPKLRRIHDCWQDLKGSKRRLHKYYNGLLREMIVELKPDDALLTADVKDFLLRLTKFKGRMTNRRLRAHPAFWTELDKLRYIIEIRNKIRFREVPMIPVLQSNFEHNARGWISVLEEVPILKLRIEKCRKILAAKGKILRPTLSDLIFFIRNSFEHLNDPNDDYESFNSYRDEDKKLTRAAIEQMFVKALPYLVSNVYAKFNFVFAFTRER